MSTNLKYLCNCTVAECGAATSKHPLTGNSVQGQFLSRKMYYSHKALQAEADAVAQNDVLANATLLRTMASTDTLAGEIAILPEPDISRSSQVDLDEQSLNTAHIHPKEFVRIQQDISHLGRAVEQRLSAFSPPQTLKFQIAPIPTIHYTAAPFVSYLENTPGIYQGTFTLAHSRHPDSAKFVAFASWLLQALGGLKSIDCCGNQLLLNQRSIYTGKITAMLERLDRIQKTEWERQLISEPAKGSGSSHEVPVGPLVVDTRSFMGDKVDEIDSIPFVCLFIVAVLHILCRVSRERCNFILVALRYLLQKAFGFGKPLDDWTRRKTMDSVPKDMRTALSHFNIEPNLISYVCCPKCCALYEQGPLDQEDAYPEYCTNKETERSKRCRARLRTTRSVAGKSYSIPIRTYLYQDFEKWLARLICRPGFEALLDKPLSSLGEPPPDIYRDIWDAPVIRQFTGGPDRQPFFRYQGREGRLLFSLSYDNFNPYHNKQAGKKVSVGSIFMVCLNLPPEERFKLENMYLVGIVPGPKQPSLTQLNHFLEPLVTALELLWEQGFFFTQTPTRPNGRLFRGVLIPVVADLHAARQTSAFGSFGSKYFCTFCGLLFQDIEDVSPNNWPPIRTCTEHRDYAEAWFKADTLELREELFDKHGVRWSILLRLPYWDPSLFTLFDSMHGWFLNSFDTHVRVVFGVDIKNPSGDGLSKRISNFPEPDPAAITKALRHLKAGAKAFKNTSKAVLFRLCESHDLRRAGTALQLQKALSQFYAVHPDILEDDIVKFACEKNPKALKANTKDDAFTQTYSRLMKMTPESVERDKRFLNSNLKSTLILLCQRRNVPYDATETKAQLVSKLVEQRETELKHDPHKVKFPNSMLPGAILGADMVKEIDADIARTVIPSWMSAGPRNFGASEHGKLKADEWRTAALVRLSITLPRVWGPRGGRFKLILDNFMHLVRAVVIGNSVAVVDNPTVANGASKSTAAIYCDEYQAYLDGIVRLFPTAKVKPNMHIAYHIGDLLKKYGPVHSWRCFVFERFIGVIQNTPINMRFGELEQTFMRSFCMAANLKALVADSRSEVIEDLRAPFQTAFSGDVQGMVLYDLLGLESRSSEISRLEEELNTAPRIRLDGGTIQLLVDYLNSNRANDLFTYAASNQRGQNVIPLDPLAWSLVECRHGGIWYRRVRPLLSPARPSEVLVPHRDSHVLIRSKAAPNPIPCSIQDIFAHRHVSVHGEPVTEIFLIIRRYIELAVQHREFDHWRIYPSAGCIYYDKLHEQAEIVQAMTIVAHFAKTPYQSGDIPGIEEPCIHVLPLNWVSLRIEVIRE